VDGRAYAEGVVLVGDAAHNDPIIGQELSSRCVTPQRRPFAARPHPRRLSRR
jgi:hypothetical protein